MSLAQQHLRRLWHSVSREWDRFAKGTGQSPALADAMRQFLTWKDLTTAASIRYRAVRRQMLMPSATVLLRGPVGVAAEVVRSKNTWVQKHLQQTQPIVDWVVTKAVQAEEDFLRAKSLAIEAGLRSLPLPDEMMLISRQRRFARDRVMEVVNVAEQVQLADPYIGNKFPMSSYYSREDRRVRPTHAAMNGTVAVRGWEGWAYCRPPCGYGCRCTLRHWSLVECIQKGWWTPASKLHPGGRAKFVVRWSSPKAKANYLRGVPFHDNIGMHAFGGKQRDFIFPDVGPWMQAKFVALPEAA